MNAAHRAMQADAAAYLLLVDAKNPQALAFYQRYGFRPLSTRPMTLFLALATVKKAFFPR